MDAFSLLKYWKRETGAASRAAAETVTVVVASAVSDETAEADNEDDGDDDGPFFDLKFAAAPEEGKAEFDCTNNDDDDGEFDFTISSSSGSGSSNNNNIKDLNLSVSSSPSPRPPSDDLVFNGDLVGPLDSSSLSSTVLDGSESSLPKNQFPLSASKSGARFRVFMLRFKKSRSERGETNESTKSKHHKPQEEIKTEKETQRRRNQKEQSKLFTVKLKAEEVVPIVSLFTTSRIPSNGGGEDHKKPKKQVALVNESVSDNEKRFFSKDVLMMKKYLKMVKPFYVRASRWYEYGGGGEEKLRFFSFVDTAVKSRSRSPSPSPSSAASLVEDGKNVGRSNRNIPARLRVVCKRLGKSQSASVTAAMAAAAAEAGGGDGVVSRRRDDSLLEQQDGIQSAILHCKRSFNGF